MANQSRPPAATPPMPNRHAPARFDARPTNINLTHPHAPLYTTCSQSSYSTRLERRFYLSILCLLLHSSSQHIPLHPSFPCAQMLQPNRYNIHGLYNSLTVRPLVFFSWIQTSSYRLLLASWHLHSPSGGRAGV